MPATMVEVDLVSRAGRDATCSVVGALVGLTPSFAYFLVVGLDDDVSLLDSLAIVGVPVGGVIGAVAGASTGAWAAAEYLE